MHRPGTGPALRELLAPTPWPTQAPATPRAVKTRMPASQSGSACLPERDETSRTLLLLLAVHACGIYADGTDGTFVDTVPTSSLRPHNHHPQQHPPSTADISSTAPSVCLKSSFVARPLSLIHLRLLSSRQILYRL